MKGDVQVKLQGERRIPLKHPQHSCVLFAADRKVRNRFDVPLQGVTLLVGIEYARRLATAPDDRRDALIDQELVDVAASWATSATVPRAVKVGIVEAAFVVGVGLALGVG